MKLKEQVHKGIVGGLYDARWNRTYAGQDEKLPIEMWRPHEALAILRLLAGERNTRKLDIPHERRPALERRMKSLVLVIARKMIKEALDSYEAA
jgi:hypothetical protein